MKPSVDATVESAPHKAKEGMKRSAGETVSP